jgi:hypothetical protein
VFGSNEVLISVCGSSGGRRERPDNGDRNFGLEFRTSVGRFIEIRNKIVRKIRSHRNGTAFHPDPALKLSTKLYDMYHYCV